MNGRRDSMVLVNSSTTNSTFSKKEPVKVSSTKWGLETTSSMNRNPNQVPDTSSRETLSVTSTWGIGWYTPTLMGGCYLFALIIAITHLLVFRYIDGKEADGPDRVAAQVWITTLSNVLANSFGYAFRSALSIAFAQYLWHLLRVSTMKVSTIEALFTVRANPFLLLKVAALRATPLLCTLALVMWISQGVTSFPPGAITVTTSLKTTYKMIEVPTFNASFMGNGSGVEANANSFWSLTPAMGLGFVTGVVDDGKDGHLLTRLSRQVLLEGQAFDFRAPCGANCSYITQFEGPWFGCNKTATTSIYGDIRQNFTIYSGRWISPARAAFVRSSYNGTYSNARFNTSTLVPLEVNGTEIMGPGKTSGLIQEFNSTCLTYRARYTVNTTFQNNILHRTVVAVPIDRLVNLALQTYEGLINVPKFNAPDDNELGTEPADWSADTLAYYRDNNMMAIIGSMMSWLEGDYEAWVASNETSRPFVGGGVAFEPHWIDQQLTNRNGAAVSIGQGTFIDSTRFNDAFGRYSTAENRNPSFNITQETLNDYLLNITTSVMMAYGRWNTTVNATTTTIINIYSFSEPLNLILPYFVSLAVALPFLVFGSLALFWNGVSAIDGGFMQLITTTTGSATLDKAAAGGCLGGRESVPKELEDLEIRYGELMGQKGMNDLRRAGFGVESEVAPLRKGSLYGTSRWI